MRRPLLPLLVTGLALASVALLPSHAQAQKASTGAMNSPAKPTSAGWDIQLQGEQKAAHILNRLAFGARPGDIAAIQRIGFERWIQAQLRPENIDDNALESKLANLKYLNANPALIQLAYEGDNGMLARFIKQRADSMKEKGRNNRQVARLNQPLAAANNPAMEQPQAAIQPVARQELVVKLNQKQEATLREFDEAGMLPGESMRVVGELSTAKIIRAVESNRQLQEVLVDFWSNHFNVDVRKNAVRALKIQDDRAVIRPHIFGSFREILGASAKSPAMLVYLDNARSTAETTMRNGNKRGGLNENYARELMELHTLGVDGGYSQKDVTEVARCLTGWSVDNRSVDGPRFQFRPLMHDRGEKTVLGRTFPAGGGQQEGEAVLDMLAAHPSTAKFIARKLCIRFVSDTPPAQLVERVAQSFTKSNGNLATVYQTLFTSPEFTSKAAYRSKIKSPFEYTVSAVRALDGTVVTPGDALPRDRQRLVQTGAVSARENNRGNNGPNKLLAVEIASMGQPLFACQPPTGYSEISTEWVSSSALVARLNFAISLTSGRVSDILLNRNTFAPTSTDDLVKQLLNGDISPETRQTILKESASANENATQLRALLLGSPEFQRR